MSNVRTYHTKEKPFVMLNKQALNDPVLSLSAVGLWSRMLSKPDNFEVNVAHLVKTCNCSKDTIYKLLNELIREGYAFRYQDRSEGKRKNIFGKYNYIIFEEKTLIDEVKKLFPQLVFPCTEVPCSGNADANNTDYNKKERESRCAEPSSHEEPKQGQELKAYGEYVRLSDEQLAKSIENYGQAIVDHLVEAINFHCGLNKPEGYRDYAKAMQLYYSRMSDDKKARISNGNTPSSSRKKKDVISPSEVEKNKQYATAFENEWISTPPKQKRFDSVAASPGELVVHLGRKPYVFPYEQSHEQFKTSLGNWLKNF